MRKRAKHMTYTMPSWITRKKYVLVIATVEIGLQGVRPKKKGMSGVGVLTLEVSCSWTRLSAASSEKK